MTSAVTIRPARHDDVPAVVAMVHELAEFERAADQCHLTEEQLRTALCGPDPSVFAHVAADADEVPVGFALWYVNFSTWEGTHGVHLEDLYVRPAARGTGTGAALLAALAAICVERGYRRLEWVMLD
ncbi:GNAT family N-acetyltransferase [Jidongwangia harbinensis]|uniref:GNAT family N-acetyltransferase n=1 Tax=Jidongwangia harbinensis TaxID=2878561 RepID=UPI0027E00C9C|nr:GNAT family N-acetyltransferase [Jidongwangia harbinensis]